MGAAQLAFFQLSGAVLLGGTTKTFRGPRPAPVAEAVTLSPLVFGTLRLHRGRKRVIQVRFNMSVPRARVPEKASTRRERSEG